MAQAEDRYVFYVEWFDAQADLLRRYMLTYYKRDKTIDMYDPKNKRPFLKRSEYPEVKLSDLYIGAIITVFARQLKVVEYADAYTRKALETQISRTLALVKPDAYNHIGQVLSAAHSLGLVVARLSMVRMNPDTAGEFCGLFPHDEAHAAHAAHLQSDVVVAMELVGEDAIEKWKSICGPRSHAEAKQYAPRSLRAIYGSGEVKNAVHCSEDAHAAAKQLDFFFERPWPTTALLNNCTLCIVRPHALPTAGGEIVSMILAEGFEISAMRQWTMDKATAEEFLEVYKGVLPEYHEMVSELCNGAALVMEVRQEDAVASFRKLVGPHDPEVAKHLRPNTLRARFGIDRVRNAVHCTDLPEDGLLEVEYFFDILYRRA
eukprot:CAMPEP_0194512674 /NCGR_PEP_ID=MMETSP0253-20130528/44745_1 /TAXON_ID=2966 /ORGANISM="Noctiluca scintillans" /LENGTH=374 /DNA_ID=CAMNT_0039356159 /DNA_START=12 /DNA_END=1136 /DNA_ORIENTATION=+